MLVVVVVEDPGIGIGIIGGLVEDCSVVVVLSTLSEPPQPASKAVTARSATPIDMRPDFVLVMGNSVWEDFRE